MVDLLLAILYIKGSFRFLLIKYFPAHKQGGFIMNFIKLVVYVFVLPLSSFLTFAQGVPISLAPEPNKDMVIKTCSTGYYLRENPKCLTKEFLERRGDDLVFLVQEGENPDKKEYILTGDLSTKVRPYPPATYKPHSYFLQFPMKNGSSWKGSFEQEGSNGRIQKRTRSAEVVGYGDIKLPAGVFKAYEIHAYNQWSEASRPAREKYFYCPELSTICSYESIEFDIHAVVVEVRKKGR